ncbi:MAG: uracil-DNA glycosylase [Gammaproteobacteria bacterium]|nr:MAG: uracil-DNA glycosylase [Gammaproteobacteria bacterium]
MEYRQQLQYLDSLGIRVWVPRDFSLPESKYSQVQVEPAPANETKAQTSDHLPVDIASLGWDELRDHALRCTACRLHAERTQAVFGVGNQTADLMVIGEAPGADEDQQGEPFVGRAGQLLNEMLYAIGYPRETVYIANIVKCRPPENRNPQHDEALSCAPLLSRQISLIQPKAILAVGKVAAQNLLQTDLPIGKMRGTQYRYAEQNIPVMVTYHPAYLLRSPREKRKVWQDLVKLRELLSEKS